MDIEIDLFRNIGIALALGLLIGIERGWSARGEPAGGRVAGIRTFGLLGLLGGIAGFAVEKISVWAGLLLIASAAAALIAGYIRDMERDGNVSATTTIAGVVTLALGAVAVLGFPVIASVCGGVMLLLLSMREELHAWVGGLSIAEVKAVARFALIVVVVWPLLPDANYGPYDAWNPRDIWGVVVLISGLSFAGYLATKRLGDIRGALATASAGAVVSSTAVTVALSRRLAEGANPMPQVAGIAAAGAVMMARTLVLTFILADFAATALAVVVIPAGLVAIFAAVWAARHSGDGTSGSDNIRQANPFDLIPALGFAALLAGAALFARWALAEFGENGLATVLAITGAFDVDAAIVTLGGLPQGTVTPRISGMILAGPILINSAFKAAVIIGIAGWQRGRTAALSLIASLAAGAAALAALYSLG